MKQVIKDFCDERRRAEYQEFWNLDRLEKAFYIQEEGCPSYDDYSIIIREGFLGILETHFSSARGLHGFYPKKRQIWLFKYDLNNRKGKIVADRGVIFSILKEFTEWEFLKTLEFRQCLSMTVVRDILLGKLTSVDSVIRAYFKSLGIKGYSGKELLRLCCLGSLTTTLAVFNVDDLIPALRDDSQKCILQRQSDLIDQAYLLGVKLNPRWSEKRFYEEHQKLTHILMQHKLEKMGNLPVWDLPEDLSGYPGIPEHVKLLNTEREVFEEGLYMHHCVYTNYWRVIREKKYLAFSIKLPSGERATLGIDKFKDSWDYNQCYKKYDRDLEPAEFLYVEKVCEALIKLFNK